MGNRENGIGGREGRNIGGRERRAKNRSWSKERVVDWREGRELRRIKGDGPICFLLFRGDKFPFCHIVIIIHCP